MRSRTIDLCIYDSHEHQLYDRERQRQLNPICLDTDLDDSTSNSASGQEGSLNTGHNTPLDQQRAPPADHDQDARDENDYGGEFRGQVKLFKHDAGWGFVHNQSTGEDVWFHISQCVDTLTPLDGDTLRFDEAPSAKKPGTFIA
eukprot:10863118-Heterocapsa_arctica.AAC.1